MVDIHCHIIPEVDDGPRTWEVAAEMCRVAASDGIRHIVATPHANEEYAYNRDDLKERLARLKDISGNLLNFSLGCDFHFSYENIRDCLDHPERYRIGTTNYLLVEFSDFAISPNASEHLGLLQRQGLVPIITHPERNPILQRRPELVQAWVRQGAIVQITANALTGRWGPIAKKAALRFMSQGAAHVIATDAHDLRSRPPVLSAAREELARLADPQTAHAMVDANPRAIVEGQPLPFVPAPA
ncbi:MAG TPA: CpsB/CapC family capsule biosynthesis tyrosine phosphatase [Terriglobales bacterium]|nr:CpsB/CapC family capsule biosynthesis tyrosine phosphatase [Terriglobales bacterium]